MTPATVHHLSPPPAPPPSAGPGDAPRIVLVPPGEIPPGAVVLGHVVALAVEGPPVPAPAAPLQGQAQSGLVVDAVARRVVRDGSEVSLTRREFDLLAHLVGHPGQVFTRAQLLASVWELPQPGFAPPRTVDVHVARLRRKLGTHASALQSLRGVGYRWCERTRIAGVRP
jgi:Transcriptional regulatory protein, C terminal